MLIVAGATLLCVLAMPVPTAGTTEPKRHEKFVDNLSPGKDPGVTPGNNPEVMTFGKPAPSGATGGGTPGAVLRPAGGPAGKLPHTGSGSRVLLVLGVALCGGGILLLCLLYTSPSPRDLSTSRMPSSA